MNKNKGEADIEKMLLKSKSKATNSNLNSSKSSKSYNSLFAAVLSTYLRKERDFQAKLAKLSQ